MIDLSLLNPQLDGDPFFFSGNEVGILLIHGLTATTAEVRVLANKFLTEGWTISAPLLPGHGTSLLDLEKCHWKDWVLSAERAYLDLAEICPYVFVGGESMGGLLAAHLAGKYSRISGVLLYAPAFSAHRLWLTPLIQYFLRFKSKPNLNDGLPWKGYKYHSTKAGVQLLWLQNAVKQNISKINQPLAMFLGKKDHTISLNTAEAVFDRIPSVDKTIHIYGESSHCMILDSEVDQIATDSITFIQRILNSKTD
jgi:carboxylesterase